MKIETIKQIIPNSEKFLDSKKLTLGWSGEDKYIITLSDSGRALLRVLEKESFYSQIQAIKLLQKFSSISDAVPKILDFGISNDDKYGYILLEYIEGINAMSAISQYSISEQYNLGLVMGETIKKLHSQSCPVVMADEMNSYFEKVKTFLDYYCENKEKFPFISDKETYVRNFLQKIKNRPFVIIHNDFHLGNMIVDKNKISLIDFNRTCFGDYVKEFDGIAWCERDSKYFAQGIIDSYLNDEDDEREFFTMLKGYINIWQIQMLYFIRDQDDEEKNIVINLLKNVEMWYDEDDVIPSWYLN